MTTRAALPLLPLIATPLLLVGSNIFMTYAWYGHLRDLKASPLWIAIGVSWLVAFFEYCLQVPANRIGYEQAGYSLAQLKVMQEVITMAVFAAFAILYMREKLSMNFVYAGICLVAAAWFMFRDFKPAA
ncbi:MAG: hypothetical protein GC172_03380 [Phycisphaera sp.]|nr:hypothetical protein [Phycisphaera sp.]